MNSFGVDKVPYRQVGSVGFMPYSTAEIKEIGVVEITNASIFDSLDHPSKGGLHDRALGPCEYNDVCSTCGLSSLHCPGHCGYMSLPLPVFHPLFLKTLNKLLQGSCLTCHRLTAPSGAIQLALHQFQALDYGLVGTVQQLEEVASDNSLIGQHKSSADMSFAMNRKLKEILEKAISDINLEEARSNARVKNVVETHQRIMKRFIKDHLTGSRGKCPYCGVKKKGIALRNNCRFVLSQGLKTISVRSKTATIRIKQEKDAEVASTQEVSDNISGNKDLNPKEAKTHLYDLWSNDGTILGRLFNVLRVAEKSHANPMDMFFIDVILVPPSRFRPIILLKGRKLMNPRTASLRNILQDSILLKSLLLRMKNVEITDGEKDNLSKVFGKTDSEKLYSLWYKLQGHVNVILDAQLDKLTFDKQKKPPGVKQILEGKEGLFRGRMMGKRVNYVARSVISPDPFIMVDEIGVPEVFAKKLIYPEPVTPWNYAKLREVVLNGPNVHPGAVAVENEDGLVTRLNSEEMRYSFAARLLTPECHSKVGMRPKKVHRHLQNGDVLLLNRQPTLHKPSIMAHRARVLPGEKTLRLHYANCKSYNADFDGDEMNAHFPQSEIARSEGYNIASVNHQYLVPKDGTPLSGLIQDHIVAGTLLTIRGNFFTREQYQQLVYNAIPYIHTIKTLPPSIMKPQILWSGKQIVSTVIINVIPKGKQLITVEGKAKLLSKNWQNAKSRSWKAGGVLRNDDMTESEVVIHHGELLCGVLDKAHIGPTPYGLVHCCYELYGGQTSNLLLTSLARLFTSYLGLYSSFTLGIEDILLTKKANNKRDKVLNKVKEVGDEAAQEALDITDSNEITKKMRDAHLSRDPSGLKQLDFEMKKRTDYFNNKINKICIPNGLQKKFPENNLQLLVQAGAKGSTVNTMQISGLLGQVELEGRRVPLMLNGSSIPSFFPYDTSPRAGGFVTGTFLNGIRPQEYFFHCMAGREGLIDTAVKTSRSGYLQRCLIKHMEGIVVNYDMTVRDSDGSVIQFLYGEDGMDVTKMQMLKSKQFSTLAKNYDTVINKEEVKLLKSRPDIENPAPYKKNILQWKKKHGADYKIGKYHKINRLAKPKEKCPDPVISVMRPDTTFGSVSELLDKIIDEYIYENPDRLISREKQRGNTSLKPKTFRNMMYYRALKSLAQPGEPVGLLAAQSIGEPSTQMTLNTFHFAGRGEMNVTLGIPRLREILMVASANIATPTMDLPLLDTPNLEEKAEKLRVELTAVHLKQVLDYVEVTNQIHSKSKSDCFREYKVKMKFLPFEAYQGVLNATPESILKYIEKKFIKKVVEALRKKLSSMTKATLVSTSISKEKQDSQSETDSSPETPDGDVDENASSDEEEGDNDTVDVRSRARHNQDVDYEEAEEEDGIDDPSGEEDDDNTVDAVRKELLTEAGVNSEAVDQDEPPLPDLDVTDANEAGRINFVKGIHRWISSYKYSTKKRRCEFSLKLDLEGSMTDMRSLIEDEISKAVVYELPGMKRAFVVRDPSSKGDDRKMLKTEGVNFLKVFGYNEILDVRKIYSNDIHSVASHYGIEAANRAIVKEVYSVFATYGIAVDARHLRLIADYMTYDGYYKPFNRFGLESSASPLQQMSFETSLKFFTDATLTDAKDMLKSPSSKLVLGQLVGGGTGSFDLFVKLPDEPKKK